MQDAATVIHIRCASLRRLPHRGELLVLLCAQMGQDFIKGFGDEIFYFATALNHQTEHRGLHATNRQHAVIAGFTAQYGIGTRHVDAIQPVGTGTRQR